MRLRHRFKTIIRTASFALSAIAIGAMAMGADKSTRDRIDVAILMFDQVQIIDFAAPYEIFGQAGFNVFTVSKDGEEVTTVMNLKVNPEYAFSNAPKADIVLVPGGDVHEIELDQETLDWVRENKEEARYTLSVCTGARILAASGLLEGKEATTFHGDFKDFAETYPSVIVRRDQRFVDSGGVVTSAGLVSGTDSALYLVSRIFGEKRALTIASRLEYDWNPENGYIRGLLADRHLPRLPGGFPRDWKARRRYNYGDEESWNLEYKIDSGKSREVIDYLRSKLEDVTRWRLATPSDSFASSWISTFDGERWRLSAEVDTSESVLKIGIDKTATRY